MRANADLLFLLLFIGCSVQQPTSPASQEKHISITKVGWIFQNSPADYAAPFSLSMDVSAGYSGSNLTMADISDATFSSGTSTWNLVPDSSSLNDSAKILAYGWQDYFSTALSPNGSVMPIGSYIFRVKIIGVDAVADTVTIPAAGSTTANGCQYMYTEDYTGSVTSAYCPMIRRPTSVSAARTGDTIVATFAIKDTLAYGGWIWLFDSTGAYVGSSQVFRNYTTKMLSLIINNAADIITTGASNTVRICAENCFMNGASLFASVGSLRVVLTDGRQYANDQQSWDCRSVSSLAVVK